MLVKDSFNTLSNAQFEILKMFSKPMNNKDLSELKQLLKDFLSKRIDEEVDEIWETRELSQEKLEGVLNTHVKRHKWQAFQRTWQNRLSKCETYKAGEIL